MKTALAAALLFTLGYASQETALAAAPVPRPAGDFTMTEPGGKQTSLSSYKGKVIVVQFLSTTCSHCQRFSQVLTKLQGEPGLKGFQAVGIAFDDATAASVTAYIKNFNVGIPVGFADRLKVLNYLGYSVMDRIGVPQIVVIDKKGTVRAQTATDGGGKLGDEAYLRSFVASLLKESAAVSRAK